MVKNVFFQFKNRPSQSYGPYSSTSIDVKTGSPDLADFAPTQLLIHWLLCDGRNMPTVAQPLCELPELQKQAKAFRQFMQKTRWRVLAVCAMVVRPLAYRSHHSTLCQETLPDMPQLGK
jgi:hypothetical protein